MFSFRFRPATAKINSQVSATADVSTGCTFRDLIWSWESSVAASTGHDFTTSTRFFVFLSCSRLPDFQEAFQLFDQKGDGRVQVSQIGDILRALGQNPTESDVKKLTHDHRPGESDRHGGGAIQSADRAGF